MDRPICKVCKHNYAAVNYRKKGITFYRTKCDSCIRKKRKEKPAVPRWAKVGYQKKSVCERCNFRAKSQQQTLVYHLDGDLNNCSLNNLRTICLNCSVEVMQLDLPWKVAGDLEED